MLKGAVLIFLLGSCRQMGPSGAHLGGFVPKMRFSYERYYLRAAECEIRDSNFVRQKGHQIGPILSKVQEKAMEKKANWIVITGLGEGPVSDHYFFESYQCSPKQQEQVIRSLRDAGPIWSLVEAKQKSGIIEGPEEFLSERHYPSFQNFLRSKFEKHGP